MASTHAVAIVLAVVLCGCNAADYGWQPQKELTFTVQGQDVVGLPQLKPQFAGFRYNGELRVQTHSPRVLLLKFFNMTYTKIHEDLPHGWWRGSEAPLKNKSKPLQITTSTIVVKMTRFLSPELILQSGLDEWQVNFIKGIVSHLLVYLNDNTQYGHYSNKLTSSQPRDVYSVFEDSVSGRCEVLYEINPIPKQVGPANQHLCDSEGQLWEITKTRNFSNCQILSEDHAHLPTSACFPGGSNCGRFWTRASLTQMIGCGEMNNLLLLSSVSSSTKSAQLHLKNYSLAAVNSNLNITLTSVLDLKSKFNAPREKQSMRTLVYSYSVTPKELSSPKCQENVKNSEEAEDSHEHSDSSQQMNPTKGESKKDLDSIESSKPGFRNKRALKYNRYRASSNDVSDNGNSDEQPASKNNLNRFKSGKSSSRKKIHRAKSDEESSNINSNEANAISEENYNGQRGRKLDQNQQSEESDNQPSEEMDLEEHWKISGRDMKNLPPHQPFNLFALAHRTSYDPSCLNSNLRQIISDIASDLKEINIVPEKNTMEKISIAVDICRSLPFDQLSTTSEEIFEIHNGASNIMKNDERQVFRDVVTMCGSYPAFQVIKGWVERHQVEGEEAAQIISSLPNQIYSPNKYLIQDFFEMVQQIAEREDHQLTTTAVLAMSNLVRSACVNQAARQHQFSSIIKPVCDENLVAHYMDWLSNKITSDAPVRRAYIEALGNVGSLQAVDILKSIAVNPKYSSYYRTSAIFAMRYQSLWSPEMAPLLMSLYHNYSMPASARIASVALLVYAEPGLAIWQRLAISTWYEPSSAVAQFVSSSIRNIARSKDSLYWKMTKAAALVQPLARPSKIQTNRPFNLVTSWLSSDLEKLVLEQISWMQFSDYSNLYYRHSSRYSGFSRTDIEASFSVSNPDELWSALLDLIPSTNIANDKLANVGSTLGDIEENLKLHTRVMPSLQAELHFKVNNMIERMVLINKETVESLAKGGKNIVSNVLREGESFSYQKTDMESFHISTTTEMGFPVEFSVRVPWIFRTKAELNTTMDGLAFEAALLYSAQLLSSVSLMSPWDNIAHMAGAYATNFMQLPPLRLVSNIDSASDSIKMTIGRINQHRLLYFNMQPFTSQRKIKVHQSALLSPDTMFVKLDESVQMPIYGMGRLLNTVYSSERSEHFNFLDVLRQTRSVVGFPMVFSNMESKSFESVLNPLHAISVNFSMSMATKSMGVIEYDSSKETLLSRVLYSLDKITAFGQTPIMSAFRLFGGLFGGNEESSEKTTENPNTGKIDNTQSNKQDSDNNQSEEKHEKTENGTSSEKEGQDSEANSRSEDQPKKEFTSTRKQNDQFMKSNPTTKVYSTTYESAAASFNASQVDPFAHSVQDNGAAYLLDQTLSKINSGSAVVYKFDIQSAVPERPLHLSAYATYASTYSRRVQRFGLFVKKDQTQTKMTAVHEDPIDISSNLKRRIAEDLQHNIFLDFVHSTSDQKIKAFMKARLGVSRSELAVLRDSPLLEACSRDDAAIDFKCQQLREQTQQISSANITVYYSNDAKFLEKFIVKYVNAAKVMIQGTEEKAGEGFNTMNMLFDVDQKSRSVDMLIATPDTSAKISRLPLSQLPFSMLAEWATQPDAVSEYCGVSPQRFRTFDGGDSRYEMKDSWYLILHDRSRKYGIFVLAQPSGNNTMKLEVNKDDRVVMKVEEGPKVYVNDVQQPLDVDHPLMIVTDGSGQVMMHMVYTPDLSLRIRLPNEQLDLRYSSSSLIVRAGPALQGRLCGICGSYSNTGAEQYLTSQGQASKSAAEYASSFRLRVSHPQTSDNDN